MKILSKPFLITATALLAVSGVGAYVWREQSRPPVLEVYVFALKSGRSMFIRTPDDQRILVDGGGNSQVIQELTKILPFYTRRINTIIATNTEGKNVSGLVDVIERYSIDRVYVPKFTLKNLGIASSTDRIYETFIETVKKKGIQMKEIAASEEVILGQSLPDADGINSNGPSSNVSMHILFPDQPNSFDYSKASAPELLFNITYGDNSILFMGDASKKVQKFVASSSQSIISDADVLVLSHSAVPSNMSSEFMDIVRPESLVFEKAVTKESVGSSKPKTSKKKLSPLSVNKSVTKSKKPASKTKKKVVADPLAAILDEDRFNLREVGTVKIVSDGAGVIISRDK